MSANKKDSAADSDTAQTVGIVFYTSTPMWLIPRYSVSRRNIKNIIY